MVRAPIEPDVVRELVKDDVQGFVTSGYGHAYHAAYVLFKVVDATAAKEWLSSIVLQVNSAATWRIDPDEPKRKPDTLLNIAFTLSGLRAFGVPERTLKSFPRTLQEGMADPIRAKRLGDTEESAPDKWEFGGPDNPEFDVMLLLFAGQSETYTEILDAFVGEQVLDAVNGGLELVHDERGYRRDDEKELFGFADGIAQPKIERINLRNKFDEPIEDPVRTGEFILGYHTEYTLHPTVPVVAEADDPNDILPKLEDRPRDVYPLFANDDVKDLGTHGTYLVYRKLHQDVAAFWNYLGDEVERLYGERSAKKMVWLAAKFVGRWPDGTPLVPDPDALRDKDEFLYHKNDADGVHCPFGSHLRRSNPRDMIYPTTDELALDTSDKHRILRRGRIYGDELFDLSKLDDWESDELEAVLQNLQDDGAGRGLHFICVNANIQRQFEFIQDSWSNNPNFNAMYENKDPIIGDNKRSNQADSYMSIPTGDVPVRTSALPRFVTMRGGAYFFMPSLTALRYIAQV